MTDLRKDNDNNQNGYNTNSYGQNNYNSNPYDQNNYNNNQYDQNNYNNNQYDQNNYNNNPYNQNNYNGNAYTTNSYDPNYYNQNNYNNTYNQQPSFNGNFQNSHFDGSVFDTLIHMIASGLMITFTCGIATPWAVCFLWTFIIQHITIDGRRLNFDGTGAQLFGNWIKWLVLTVITCGIYSFWVYPRLFDWVATHTHFMN